MAYLSPPITVVFVIGIAWERANTQVMPMSRRIPKTQRPEIITTHPTPQVLFSRGYSGYTLQPWIYVD